VIIYCYLQYSVFLYISSQHPLLYFQRLIEVLRTKLSIPIDVSYKLKILFSFWRLSIFF